jgi:transcriptional regulator with XRE-family HTH domain
MQNASQALRTAMAASGLTQKDLATLLGSRPRASEILHGKRGISQAQAQLIQKTWNITLNPPAPDHLTTTLRAILARHLTPNHPSPPVGWAPAHHPQPRNIPPSAQPPTFPRLIPEKILTNKML